MSIQLVLISLIFQVMGFEDEQFGHNVPEPLQLLNATIHSIIDAVGDPPYVRSLVTIYHCVGKARAFAAAGIVPNSQSLLSSFQTQPLPSRQWKSLRALNVAPLSTQLLHDCPIAIQVLMSLDHWLEMDEDSQTQGGASMLLFSAQLELENVLDILGSPFNSRLPSPADTIEDEPQEVGSCASPSAAASALDVYMPRSQPQANASLWPAWFQPSLWTKKWVCRGRSTGSFSDLKLHSILPAILSSVCTWTSISCGV